MRATKRDHAGGECGGGGGRDASVAATTSSRKRGPIPRRRAGSAWLLGVGLGCAGAGFAVASLAGCAGNGDQDAAVAGDGEARGPATGAMGGGDTVRAGAEIGADETLTAAERERQLLLADASLARLMLALNAPDEQALIEQGFRTFRAYGCVQCHTAGPESRIGPGFAGIWSDGRRRADGGRMLVDAGYIQSSLYTPQAYVRPGYPEHMHSYKEHLSPREVAALTAFIRSLDVPEPPPLDMNLARTGPAGAEPEERDALNIFNEPTADERERAEFERVPPAPKPPEEAGVRRDGRPAWWFDGLRRQGGRVLLSVETIGDGLASTRRDAVDRAYVELAERLELDGPSALRDARIELSTVLPLPNPAGGAQRYAGYVLISAEP